MSQIGKMRNGRYNDALEYVLYVILSYIVQVLIKYLSERLLQRARREDASGAEDKR